MRFALDEDVSHPLANLLRAHGYDVDSATELNRLGLTDVQVLIHAADARQTLITHNNRDFRALHEAWVSWRRRWAIEAVQATGFDVALSGHAGIIIVPQFPNRDLARIIGLVIDSVDELDDRLVSWTAS
jgi:hypothetical protein